MIWEKNNLLTVQKCTKSYIELMAVDVHPKNGNHLPSHLTAIIALDHSRLDLENKFLESKSGRIFFRLTSLLYKILLTNLRACKPTFYTFYTSHLTVWGETVLRGAVFIIQTSDRMQYFTVLKYKLQSFWGRSKHAWAFSKTAKKKFQNHLYNGRPVASCGVFE